MDWYVILLLVSSLFQTNAFPAILPRRLREYLPSDALADLAEIEGSIEIAAGYPWGSPTRNAINHSYTSTFRLILLIALILEVFALGSALLIQDLNVKTVDDSREYKGIVIGKTGAIDTLKGKIHVKRDEDTGNGVVPAEQVTREM